MRTIKKRQPPNALVQWRQARIAAADPIAFPFDYKSFRNSASVVEAVEVALLQEQGGLCAYTGRRISLELGPPQLAWFHLEHLKGQTRCRDEAALGQCELGYDTHYSNLAACWPEPNRSAKTPYGADLKADWPKDESEDPLFVSPLTRGCTRRFKFDRNGGIKIARDDDKPAAETIEKLGLDHDELIALRKSAIRGAFAPLNRPITAAQAEKLRTVMDNDEAALDQGENVTLREFCFVLRPLIDKEISKLKAIEKQKKKKTKRT